MRRAVGLRGDLRLPAGWWGPAWAAPEKRTLEQLQAECAIAPLAADLLWELVERGSSLTVAAGPSGAGKSTLLTSLLDALPEARTPVVVRGIHEQFERMPVDPATAALLVSEISPHLPAYVWGQVAWRCLEFAHAGSQLLTTIHAQAIDDVVRQLAGDPLHIPLKLIAALGVITFLDGASEQTGRGRVTRIESLAFDPESGGLRVTLLWSRDA